MKEFVRCPNWDQIGKIQFIHPLLDVLHNISEANKNSFSGLETHQMIGYKWYKPINKVQWQWYKKHVEKEMYSLVNTLSQTKTRGKLISSLADVVKTNPTHKGLRLTTHKTILINSSRKKNEYDDVEEYLYIKFLRSSIIGLNNCDRERCHATYFSTYKTLYLKGIDTKQKKSSKYRITGMVEVGVFNVPGNRIGKKEVEKAINQNRKLTVNGIVGYNHVKKNQINFQYIISDNQTLSSNQIRNEILETAFEYNSKITKKNTIQFLSNVHKIKIGKKYRRILKDKTDGETGSLKDTSTLLVDNIYKGRL
jgi:acetyl-CoA synthetase